MVSAVAFQFSVMRCQPLRRALCAFLFNIPFLLIHP
ncbi:acetyltransferase [Vibrio cholerae]|nr:acetyltransferase [Vibrio cholerae]